jgi:hypothetical protein
MGEAMTTIICWTLIGIGWGMNLAWLIWALIGARDKMVYFYDTKGVTSKMKWKDFLK